MQANVLVRTLDLEHSEWLKFRRTGIGGSDAGAIAGMNPWKSPIAVYLEKIGQVPEQEDNEKMRIGRDLEEYVAKRFEEKTGKKVRRKNAILQHPEHEWMIANVDRLVVGEKAGLECKVTNSYAKKNWEENIPPMYELQCHHYMAVTGYDKWYLAVLIGNEEICIKEIPRDEEIINYLIELEKGFWENHVLKREMPAPDGSKDAGELLKMMYPESNGKTLETLEKHGITLEILERYDELNEIIKKLQQEQEQIKQEIQKAMGEYEKAYLGDRLITWKTVASKRIDTKKMKKEMPEVYEKYCQEVVSRRFQIK